ncbi:hypothetical protein V8G54_024784 [Vigna mungo]|uniref:Transmembrane protein n=1 Tax=Vigna mungo TaxID=3915 RepID=A0AAQ3RSX5_VIGMU
MDLQTGQESKLDPQPVQTHRCLHGKISTHDSFSPHFLHNLFPPLFPLSLYLFLLLLLLTIIIFSFISLQPSFSLSCAPVANVRHPSSLLPQHDSASSSAVCGGAATCARTCSRLVRRTLAVASLV